MCTENILSVFVEGMVWTGEHLMRFQIYPDKCGRLSVRLWYLVHVINKINKDNRCICVNDFSSY